MPIPNSMSSSKPISIYIDPFYHLLKTGPPKQAEMPIRGNPFLAIDMFDMKSVSETSVTCKLSSREWTGLTTDTVTPGQNCESEQKRTQIENDSDGSQEVDDFVGQRVDPRNRYNETEVRECPVIWRRIIRLRGQKH